MKEWEETRAKPCAWLHSIFSFPSLFSFLSLHSLASALTSNKKIKSLQDFSGAWARIFSADLHPRLFIFVPLGTGKKWGKAGRLEWLNDWITEWLNNWITIQQFSNIAIQQYSNKTIQQLSNTAIKQFNNSLYFFHFFLIFVCKYRNRRESVRWCPYNRKLALFNVTRVSDKGARYTIAWAVFVLLRGYASTSVIGKRQFHAFSCGWV